MSDNLRDRIAAALSDEYDHDCMRKLDDSTWLDVANVVIAALGLEAESKSYFDGMSPGYTMTRYVTEWTAEE